MATTKEGVEQVLRDAFVGKRLTVELRKGDELICEYSFVIKKVAIQDEDYVAVIGGANEGKFGLIEFELIEIGRAITLADRCVKEYNVREGVLIKFTLEGGEKL